MSANPTENRRRPALTTVLVMGVTLSLLMWAKLKLVSDFPRSVYAGSESVAPESEPDPSPPLPPDDHPAAGEHERAQGSSMDPQDR